MFCSYFIVKNPSWSEINNFMKFLSFQLEAMEETCRTFDIPVVPGLKEFSIGMMIKMSKVVCILQYKCFKFVQRVVWSLDQQVVCMHLFLGRVGFYIASAKR